MFGGVVIASATATQLLFEEGKEGAGRRLVVSWNPPQTLFLSAMVPRQQEASRIDNWKLIIGVSGSLP